MLLRRVRTPLESPRLRLHHRLLDDVELAHALFEGLITGVLGAGRLGAGQLPVAAEILDHELGPGDRRPYVLRLDLGFGFVVTIRAARDGEEGEQEDDADGAHRSPSSTARTA